MGGMILAHPQINWTIFALCRARDKDRAPKFRKVCKYYRARAIVADLEDEDIMSVRKSIPKIRRIIKQKIGKKRFDYIFTHGRNGEYGHPRHIGVHLAVRDLAGSGAIPVKHFFNFAYKTDKSGHIKNGLPAKFYIKLTYRELIKKRNVIKGLYGFGPRSFENISSIRQETFK